MYLYHTVIEQDSDIHINPQNALNEGLNIRTVTRLYTNGGDLYPEITDRFKSINSPKWIDFKIAFGAELVLPTKPYLRFPTFSDKILVFNQDISSDLFAYIEDEYMEEETGGGYFTEGLPSKEDLVSQYWESMLTIEEYLNYKPYKEPEILIFETVPAKLIEYIK
ncbi:hypothetical protein E1B06_16045 [Brevibacillus laterosporus]|uniref:hypothetical protein n=1 Tax=Brevibacillus laterosporus TaxID=1465 RepID=UPI0024071229|nr:hypothetical protein [Brevibacillus laterosporus]MDF9413195.1 hypothetical protein [Brevibacillus laterosporus]